MSKENILKRHMMLDIECLSKTGIPAIVQIGACYFNMQTGAIHDTFKVNINLESSTERGFTIDADTTLWWLHQSNEARHAVFFDEKYRPKPVVEAFTDFQEFCHGAKNVWSHATFDASIVLHAYSHLKMQYPFHYRTCRDLRTIVYLANYTRDEIHDMKEERIGTHHDALEDCLHQVKYTVAAVARIRGEQ